LNQVEKCDNRVNPSAVAMLLMLDAGILRRAENYNARHNNKGITYWKNQDFTISDY